ncbi:MAG: hypothetical protein H0U27_02365 [Nitrosopumilus sp.]|nr:hypothetical protein [Nitrosopumilus sp.]
MIPKIIHYVWVGGEPVDKLSKSCIESWKYFFPDYKIIKWDENNSPNNKYLKTALNNKKWSNASNFLRLYALKEFGGLYFDTDFEVIKRFDFLNDIKIFFGFQSDKIDVNNAIMGSIKGEPFIIKCMNELENTFDGMESAALSSPILTTNLLIGLGLKENKRQVISNIHLFPRDFFSPFDWNDKFTFSCLTENTYGIHHWSKSWLEEGAIDKMLYYKHKLKDLKNGHFSLKQLINLNKQFILRKVKSVTS